MSYYFLNATKDATIYAEYPQNNSGMYSILEISKKITLSNTYVSRILIQFDVDSAKNFIQSRGGAMSTAMLYLNESQSDEIPLDYTIMAHPVSGSWDMGTGRHLDVRSLSGVTWNGRGSRTWIADDLDPNVVSTTVDGTGGVWYTTPNAFSTFSYSSSDIRMDVTNIVSSWISGSIDNSGFILKYSSTIESNDVPAGSLKFFSKETNTIYQPKLAITWDDHVFTTGSLMPIIVDNTNPSNISILATNLKSEYRINTSQRFRVVGRYLSPLKTFANPYPYYGNNMYLPRDTYYSVVDSATGFVVIPFSPNSKVSCDEIGNYVDLNFYNWEPNRTYVVHIRYDADTYTYDIGHFKFRLLPTI
jgi:hypothetical protein